MASRGYPRIEVLWMKRPKVGDVVEARRVEKHETTCQDCSERLMHTVAQKVEVRVAEVTTCSGCNGEGATYGFSGSDGVAVPCDSCEHKGFWVKYEILTKTTA